MRVAIIGAGNMAEALVRGALDNGVLSPEGVVACRRDPERLAAVGERLGVRTTTDAAAAVVEAELVLLAVKPQQLGGTMAQLGPHLGHRPLLLSVLAGSTTAAIEQAAGGELPVVRCMPNTPAFVGQGMAPYCLGRHATDAHAATAERFLAASGRTLRVEEHEIDAITAVSGCGPAYLFLLAEAMEAGAHALGVDPGAARALVKQTLLGAAHLLEASDQDPAALRRQVTSPGGATARAIGAFEAAGFGELVEKAMDAARRRAEELGRGDA